MKYKFTKEQIKEAVQQSMSIAGVCRCPNCYSQTNTHRGKNKLSTLSEKREVKFRKFGEGLTANTEPSCNNTEGVETRHGTPKS